MTNLEKSSLERAVSNLEKSFKIIISNQEDDIEILLNLKWGCEFFIKSFLTLIEDKYKKLKDTETKVFVIHKQQLGNLMVIYDKYKLKVYNEIIPDEDLNYIGICHYWAIQSDISSLYNNELLETEQKYVVLESLIKLTTGLFKEVIKIEEEE